MKDILFLECDDIIEIHSVLIKKYGGHEEMRDKNLLHSAVNQPQQTFAGQFFYKSIPTMASIYAYHLAGNQPFMDGNKRTVFTASNVFLKLNGFSLSASSQEVYLLFIDLANKRKTKDELTDWYLKKSTKS
ncbi:type II toxin-antitoxin system death-on-curing family toxin [candidate division KSB1 bacterium]|nr:type II toxin-antitoxin system death-on-curing family toxin [candidate division KSB1 bacterium]